ncbi:LysM peptidoglycan-binding domain-containing protein [Rhodococcus sp. IEGM 1379]|uniref:LysM peptidoglycan-binding domain-containing protein n=1 Tax=Rhodococcus sp. IEGM 1379 TaxID=3047086 RepID=UPI0024B6D808|nr:LysM peptidoglycan-binding domain-containing protein [Rhodococcus sp. IEGM 1379]
MGNAALKSEVFDDAELKYAEFDCDVRPSYGTASGNAGRSSAAMPKYHASFYDAAPYDEAVGAMPYRVRREVSDIRERRDGTRESGRDFVVDRRLERDVDRARPQGGNFEHRNRVGVSRASHAVDSVDVGWRSVVLGVLLTAVAVLGLVGLASVSVGGVSGPVNETGVVRVAAGETLSDIAAQVAPGQSAGVVISRIMDLNAMSNSKLSVGQTLIVPAAQVR